MTLKQVSDTNAQLFHSVNLDWYVDGFVFWCSYTVKDEAEYIIRTLISLLQHFYPQLQIDRHFTKGSNILMWGPSLLSDFKHG